MALAIGAAFGAYMLARRFALRFKWTGVISSLIVGVLSGLVLLVFAAIFPVTVGGSYSDYSASASLSGVSFRTFCMAFLLSAAGALAGYALAQYAGDSGNVFSAAWRWAHRARGFVRTLVESFAIYGVLFLVLGLVATIAMSAANHLGAGGLLLVPLLFPALPLMLISLSSFGGIAFSTSSYSVHTITLFNVSSLSQYGWILWICFVLFLLATFYIALRETARNMYDPYYAGWQHTWKAPVAAMVFWLAAEFLFTYFAAGYASSSMSMTTPMWYFLVAGIWAFLIEVAAMTFGPTLVASLPGMWQYTITLNGFSKAFAMTGWRVGYACGPKEILSVMLKIHQYSILCAPRMGQVAALEALQAGRANDYEDVRRMRDSYDRRRRLMVDSFRKMGLDCFEPLGAFYVFPSIKKTGLDSETFCERLLNEYKIATVPGTAFGECGEGHIRCSYATGVEKLNIALERMSEFVDKCGK